MHYTEPIMRPPCEGYSILIEATAGCSHNKCTFCSAYKETCFRIAPMEQIKQDIIEAGKFAPLMKAPRYLDATTHYVLSSAGTKNNERVFLLSGDAFAMSFKDLKQIALWIHEYIPSTKVITAFTTVNDIKRKTLEELKELAALGYNDLYVGTETGSPDILTWVKKGHTVQDALEQLHKLEEAAIRYSVQYITGLAGSGNGVKNAIESAEFFNQIHPYMIGSSSLTLFPDTELGKAFARGEFREASELERIEETRVLLDNLKINTFFSSQHISSMIPTVGLLPDDKEKLLSHLDRVISELKSMKTLPKYNRSIV